MHLRIIIVIFAAIIWWSEARRGWPYDMTATATKQDFLAFTFEYATVCRRLFSQAEPIRKIHSKFIAYDVGYMMGMMREHYKELVMTANQILYSYVPGGGNTEGDISYNGSFVATINYYWAYNHIKSLAWKIEGYIDLLEAVPPKKMFPHKRTTTTPAPVKKQKMRAQEDETELEELYKKRMRFKFEMRRRGINATDDDGRVPIEETWRMDGIRINH